jgi:hypothetical protein
MLEVNSSLTCLPSAIKNVNMAAARILIWKPKNSIRLKSQTGVQLWKTWMMMMMMMMMRASIGLRNVLGYKKFCHRESRLL